MRATRVSMDVSLLYLLLCLGIDMAMLTALFQSPAAKQGSDCQTRERERERGKTHRVGSSILRLVGVDRLEITRVGNDSGVLLKGVEGRHCVGMWYK